MGPPAFGAREAAGNSLDDFARLVTYAHRYWVKVYATVNTLLRDEEIPAAVRLIHQLYAIGVDAVIIQDVGLLECDLPPIPLTASTQMHNHTPERVAFLERVGFHRAVLARELSFDQIRAIRQAAPRIELEVFVHGALCVSYSGQCFMSYALGGRSGNRGQCAQPCRKAYTLRDRSGRVLVHDRHLLSLRDLNRAEHLHELAQAGITSFKIEGRLKDETYVSNVTAYYRNRLDEVLGRTGARKSSSGTSRGGFTADPDKTFNRGYTDYFLRGERTPMSSPETPKMVGPPVGRAVSVQGNEVLLDRGSDIGPGDGLCFFDRNQKLRGSTVNRVKGRTVELQSADGLESGITVHRNHDHGFLLDIRKNRPRRTIAIAFTVRQDATGLRLCVKDEEGLQAEAAQEGLIPMSRKPEQGLATIRKQLSKSGDREFLCTDVHCDLEAVPFLPRAAWNALRRRALEALSRERERHRPRLATERGLDHTPFPETELSYRGNVLNTRAETFYRRHGVKQIEPAAESGLDLHGRAVMCSRYCLKFELGFCPQVGRPPVPPEPLTLEDHEGNHFRLQFDCTACQMTVFLARRSNSAASHRQKKDRLKRLQQASGPSSFQARPKPGKL